MAKTKECLAVLKERVTGNGGGVSVVDYVLAPLGL